MILDGSTQKVEYLLNAAVNAAECAAVAHWSDVLNSGASEDMGTTVSASNGVTGVSLVPGPSSGQRLLRMASILCRDTVPVDVHLRYYNGSDNRTILKATLAPGDRLAWSRRRGWHVRGGGAEIRTLPSRDIILSGELRYATANGSTTAGTARALTSGQTIAVYLGRADRDFSAIQTGFSVGTAASSVTWSEVGIATGAPIIATGAKLTTLAYTPFQNLVTTASAHHQLTFQYGGWAGQELWFLYGLAATGMGDVLTTFGDTTSSGVCQIATAQPSTMAADTTFTVDVGAIPRVVWQLH